MAVTVSNIIPAKTTVNVDTGCLEWTGFKNRDGYGVLHRGGKLIKAHRLAYCNANGKLLDDIAGLVVRHKCDNRKCLNPDHLEIGTNADNTHDRHTRGRDAKGPKNGNSKLTEAEIIAIRRDYRGHCRQTGARPLAKKYGVSVSLISQIVSNAIWQNVEA